jgi:hypothetical protein
MKIDGRCHCGTISYEAEIDPEKVVICHCTDCQTLSGSAFRTVALTHENAFRILQGEPKIPIAINISYNNIRSPSPLAVGTEGLFLKFHFQRQH